MTKHEAILALHTNVAVIRGDDAFDADGNPVIYDETAVQAYIDAHAYIAKRQQAYPSIADQLDLIYHQGLDAWKSAIQAVKEEFPK
jgi:fructose-1,6-bisphosphatase